MQTNGFIHPLKMIQNKNQIMKVKMALKHNHFVLYLLQLSQVWFQRTFWGLCILPLEFLTLANVYRKENLDLFKSQRSSPIIPAQDHMTFPIMCFLPRWRAQNKYCTAVHSPALQSSVWPLLLSELWPFLSLPVREGYKLLYGTGYFSLVCF